MGALVDGKWEETPLVTSDSNGRFSRVDSVFRRWIMNELDAEFKAEAGRYHLYVSYACPWACRTLVFRSLKGLKDCVSVSYVESGMHENGWEFGSPESGCHDDVNHVKVLYEIYQLADPTCSTRVTVPVLWDKKTKTIVNNESSEIIRMLNSEFDEYATNPVDFYPEPLRTAIDEINDFVYDKVNNGVYKCGFAATQLAYEEAFDQLFSALDKLEEKLSKQRYLAGSQITEADWRLFTTLIRFDVVYVGHFKCNLRRIEDYPNLSNYLRELYQVPGVKETVNFEHIKHHYYTSHKSINPTGIVPKGPMIDFERPHDRHPKKKL